MTIEAGPDPEAARMPVSQQPRPAPAQLSEAPALSSLSPQDILATLHGTGGPRALTCTPGQAPMRRRARPAAVTADAPLRSRRGRAGPAALRSVDVVGWAAGKRGGAGGGAIALGAGRESPRWPGAGLGSHGVLK